MIQRQREASLGPSSPDDSHPFVTGSHPRILEATLEAMREGVCVYDGRGVVVYANRAAEAMYGSGRGGLIGHRIAELSARPEWEGAHVQGAIEARLHEGEMWSGDRHNRRLDGGEFITAARVSALELEGRSYRLCVEEEVTDARRQDERSAFLANATIILGQSLDYRQTLRALARLCVPTIADFAFIDVRSETDGIERIGCAHRDSDGERALCSPAATPRLLAPAPLLLRHVRDEAVVAVIGDATDAERWRTLGVRSWLSVPITLHDELLGTIALGMSSSGRSFAEGDLEALLDLASRAASTIDNARLHAAAMAARDEAERANRAKSELLAHASHDLRTPLNAIGGYAELLEMGILGPVCDAQRDALDRIQRSQRHLLALINDLLNFTKLEAGNVEFDLMDIDMAHVARETLSLFEESAAEKGIALECLVEGTPRAWADQEKVFQIVLNLLRNAVKFTPSGGTVSVLVAEIGERAELSVRDTGIGIPPDKLEAIFEPFTQLGRSLSRPKEGSGLGLAISRELARAMRGELRVATEVGAGATFTLLLPRAPRSPRADA